MARVLLADDEPSVLELVRTSSRRTGTRSSKRAHSKPVGLVRLARDIEELSR